MSYHSFGVRMTAVFENARAYSILAVANALAQEVKANIFQYDELKARYLERHPHLTAEDFEKGFNAVPEGLLTRAHETVFFSAEGRKLVLDSSIQVFEMMQRGFTMVSGVNVGLTELGKMAVASLLELAKLPDLINTQSKESLRELAIALSAVAGDYSKDSKFG